MIRALAKWAAKKHYIFSHGFQAATEEFRARLSLMFAEEKRAEIGQAHWCAV